MKTHQKAMQADTWTYTCETLANACKALGTKSAGNHEELACNFGCKHMKVAIKFAGKTQAVMNMMKIFKIFIFKFPEKINMSRITNQAWQHVDLTSYNKNQHAFHPKTSQHA
jgi:hypothetical protein